jgi:4-hydroxybenzoate polyprenyltransferase
MSEPPNRPRPTNRGAVAGSLLLATIVLCAAIGFGIGAVVGAPVPLGLTGLFAGLVAGFAVVYTRFKDL